MSGKGNGDDRPRFGRHVDDLPRDDRRPTDTQTSPFLKGFTAGLLVAHLNRHLVLGALIGTAAGMYYQQEFGAPDVKETYEEMSEKVKDLLKPPSK